MANQKDLRDAVYRYNNETKKAERVDAASSPLKTIGTTQRIFNFFLRQFKWTVDKKEEIEMVSFNKQFSASNNQTPQKRDKASAEALPGIKNTPKL